MHYTSDILLRPLETSVAMADSQLFQRIIEKSNVIGWEADPKTFIFSYISPYAATLTGYSVEDWKKPGFWQSKLHPDDAEQAISFCQASTAQLISHEFEYRMYAADGRILWLRDIAAVESEDGSPTRLYGIMIDISAEKDAIAALAQARDDAQKADRAKTQFLANVSHELRTPLNAILGFTDFLIARDSMPAKPPNVDEYLGLIKKSASHLSSLIDDLLELSRHEVGATSLKVEPVDIVEVVQDACAMLSGLAQAKHVELSANLTTDPIYVNGDRKGLKQVVINLANNAIKFTPPSGTVAVTLETAESIDAQDGILIAVSDTGIGMGTTAPIEEEKNTQRDASDPVRDLYRDENTGIGLGLSIVTSVVKLHRGHMRLLDNPGGGTRAEVWLPLLDDSRHKVTR